mgnify:CR=1 FL=1
MKIKVIFALLSTFSIFFAGAGFANAEGENFGLGPLEIRPQYLVNQPYLAILSNFDHFEGKICEKFIFDFKRNKKQNFEIR